MENTMPPIANKKRNRAVGTLVIAADTLDMDDTLRN